MPFGREAPVRLAVLALVIVLLAGCSHSTDEPPSSGAEMSAGTLAKTCADPEWKKQNLGLWYSVCRRPLQW
jgi:outer membrane biogenesis lipoprotein LolB